MSIFKHPFSLNEEERQEVEDGLYEEQVKVSSNANLCLGLGLGFFILHGLMSTFFAMRGNLSISEWLLSLISGKFLVVPLTFILFFVYFSKYLRLLRLSTMQIMNYEEYKEQTPLMKAESAAYMILNTQSMVLMVGLFLFNLSLFTTTFSLALKIATIFLGVFSIMLYTLAMKYKKQFIAE